MIIKKDKNIINQKTHNKMKRFYKFLMPVVAIVAMALSASVAAQTTCQIKLVGEDGYGDGWNGGSLTIVQGGTTVGTFNGAGFAEWEDGPEYDSLMVTVQSGLPVSFVWTEGDYDDEVTIWIYDGGGTMLYTVNGPTQGTLYTMAQPCPSCMPVSGLTATVDNGDVDLAWTDSIASEWQIVWGSGAFDPDTVVANSATVTSTSYTIYSLTDGSYTAYVRANCGTESSNWTSVQFVVGGCFIRIEGEDAYSDGWNGGSLAVMQGGTTIQTVTMNNGATMSVQVPVASSPAVSFVWSTGSFDDEVTIRIYDGANVLKHTANYPSAGTIYTMAQPCPTCFPVNNLAATVSNSDVDLAWSDSTASEWQIVWGVGAFNPDTVVLNSDYATTNSYSIMGLADGSYNAYVRAICDAGDSSEWSSVNFMVLTNGCVLKIVGRDNYGDGWNGGSLAVVQGGTTITNFSAPNTNNGGTGPVFDSVLVGVTSGSPVSFVWTSGNYDSEVSLWIYHSSGALLYNVSNPTAGTLYTIGDACNNCFAPSALTVDSLSDDYARLSWVSNASEYGIEWGEAGGSTTVTDGSTTTNFVLTGLTSGTSYTFRVWSDCGDGTSDTVSITFSTIGEAVSTFPYTNGFELTDDLAWEFVNDGTNAWVIDSATSNSGSRALYISNNGTANSYTTTNIQFSYAYRALNITDSTQYSIAFNWKAYGEGSYDYLRAWIAPSISQLTAGHTPDGGTSAYNYMNSTPDGWIDLGGKMNLSSNWQLTTATPTLDTGIHYLVFMWANDGSSGTQPPAAVDNIDIHPLTCPTPINFSATTVTDNSIEIVWSAGGSETSWLVSDGTTATVVTDTNYTFTGLTADTNYTITLQAICNAGDSSYALSMTVHTPCAAATLPYNENFDSYTTSTSSATGIQASCWNYIMTGSASYQTGSYLPQVYYSTSYSHSGNYCYRFYGIGYHMLPLMPAPLDSLQLVFWDYRTSSSYGLEVGVMEGNTFVPVQTIHTPTSTPTEHTIYFNTYTGTSRIIAFRNYYTSSSTTYYSYIYIDDINVNYIPTCPRPLTAAIDSVTDAGIHLHWASTGAPNYEVAYSTVDDVNDTSVQTITTTDSVATITGLDPLTQYFFWVRALCGSDESYWREAGSAVTPCDTTSCNVTIDMEDDYGDGWNGNAIYVYQAGAQVGEATLANGYNGTANISVCSSTPVEFRFHSGSFPDEITVTIYDGGGAQIYNHYDMSSVSNNALLATSTNPCPSCIAPQNITLTNIGENTLTFTWTASNSESEWEVVFNGVSTIVNNNTYTATGLAGSTTYTASIRAICSAGDTSSFVNVSFRTNCTDITDFPWVEDFESTSALDCWSQEGDSEWEIGEGDYSTTTGTHSGNYNALITHHSDGDITKLISPVLNLTPGTAATLSFWHIQRSWAGDQDELRVYYRTALTEDWNLLAAYTSQISNWTLDTISLPNVTNTYQIAFEMTDSYGYGVAIDSVVVNGVGNGCGTPVVTVSNIDYQSARVTAVGGGLNFVLNYGTNPANLTNTMSSANGQFDITGLMPATQYYYSVHQECADNAVSPAYESYFFTDSLPCMPVSGLTVTGTGYESVTLTWTRGGNENAWQVIVYNTVDTFTYEAATTTYEATGLTSGVTYNANVRPMCGSNHNIEGPLADEPVTFTTDICQPVTGVSVTGISGTTATISWTAPAVAGSGSYRIEYGYAGFDRGQGQSATATATTYTIEGLESQVTYDVYVANICTETLVSVWSEVTTFETTGGQGIADVDAEGNLSIYPNPASTTVTLSVSEQMAGSAVSIVDVNGRVVMSEELNGQTLTMNIRDLAKGAYFVRITGEQTTVVRKLIVE